MRHRHLVEGVGYTLTAIDDILERGDRKDWVALRRAIERDRQLARDVLVICDGHHIYGTSNLWRNYINLLYGDIS